VQSPKEEHSIEDQIDKIYKRKIEESENKQEVTKTQTTDPTTSSRDIGSRVLDANSQTSTRLYFKIANLKEKFQVLLRSKPLESSTSNFSPNVEANLLSKTASETTYSFNSLNNTKRQGQHLRKKITREREMDEALAKSVSLISREKQWSSPLSRKFRRFLSPERVENFPSNDQGQRSSPEKTVKQIASFRRKLNSERKVVNGLFKSLTESEINLSEETINAIESVKTLKEISQIHNFKVKEEVQKRRSKI
jgi:hypothetical protein